MNTDAGTPVPDATDGSNNGNNKESNFLIIRRWWATVMLCAVVIAFVCLVRYFYKFIDVMDRKCGFISTGEVAVYFITVIAYMGIIGLLIYSAISIVKIEEY